MADRQALSHGKRVRAFAAVALLLGGSTMLPFGATGATFWPPGAAFADGSLESQIGFTPGDGEKLGPAVRLLTNGTVASARLSVEGTLGYATATAVRENASDFAEAEALEGVDVGAGNLTTSKTDVFTEYDAQSDFGGGFHNGTAVVRGNLTLQENLTEGDFTTQLLGAPSGGWGYFSASDTRGAGCVLAIWPPCDYRVNISYHLLAADGTPLATDFQPASRIPASAFEHPELALRVRFSNFTAFYNQSPAALGVHWFSFGQRIADTGSGSAVAYNHTPEPTWTARLDPTNLTKYPNNPIIRVAAGTYYSGYLSQPHVLQVGGEWWMYLSAGTEDGGYRGAGIARAVSRDLTNWTMDPSPLLTPGSTYDSYGLLHPYVLQNPEGPGLLMYYTAFSTLPAHTIARATSVDGVLWTKTGVVLSGGSGWDSESVGQVPLVKYNASSDTWTMWYSGTAVSTGGGSSVGIATSRDGINWTRHAGNPVLARGAWYDSGDLQGGKVIEVNGTMDYYYNCNGGTYRTCLAQSTDGGFAWTKRGIVLDLGSGWDSSYSADPAPVLTPLSFYVFYAGLGQGSSQIGLARGDHRLPSFTGTFDLGADPPLTLDRFSASMPASSTSSFTFGVRSSADGVNWTPWEGVSPDDVSIGTKSQRFVQYHVAGANAFPPELQGRSSGVELFTTSHRDFGRYLSDPLSFTNPVDRARVDPTEGGKGRVLWNFTSARAPGQVPAFPGAWADFPWGQSVLWAEAFLVGNQSASPFLEAATFSVRMYGFPANVTVRLGLNGSAHLVAPGTLAGSLAVSLDPSEMNGWIGEAAAADPNATFVDVPLWVGSSHFGVVTVGGLAINETLKHPLSAVFGPQGRLVLYETETASFRVNASTDPGIPIDFQWWLDGRRLVGFGATIGPSFSWTTDYDDSGVHLVNVSVSNGDYTVNWTWEVLVLNLNRPPIVVSSIPETHSNVSKRAAAHFQVYATDPDGDVLRYSWFVDGALIRVSSFNETLLRGLVFGIHTIRVEVSDLEARVPVDWAVHVGNLPPIILRATPAEATTNVSHGLWLDLEVEAMDPDGDALEFVWVGDSANGRTAGANRTTWVRASPGISNITVFVKDGLVAVRHTWIVNFTNAPPRIVGRTPLAPFGANDSAPQFFDAEAQDLDGDALTFAWELDGAAAGDNASGFSTPSGLRGGVHTVRVTVSDGFGGSDFAVWSFEAPPAVQTGAIGDFAGFLWLVLVLVAAAVAAFAVRLRRPPPAE